MAVWFDDAAETWGVDTMRWLFMIQKLDQNLLFGYTAPTKRGAAHHPPVGTCMHSLSPTTGSMAGRPPRTCSNPARYDEGHPHLHEPWTSTTETPSPSLVGTGDGEGEGGSESSGQVDPTILDRWIIARLRQAVIEMTEGYEAYVPLRVAQPAEAFLDDLSNWYVRRSRRRFWAARGESPTSDADKAAAYQTLYTVLVTAGQGTGASAPLHPGGYVPEPRADGRPNSTRKRYHCLCRRPNR